MIRLLICLVLVLPVLSWAQAFRPGVAPDRILNPVTDDGPPNPNLKAIRQRRMEEDRRRAARQGGQWQLQREQQKKN